MPNGGVLQSSMFLLAIVAVTLAMSPKNEPRRSQDSASEVGGRTRSSVPLCVFVSQSVLNIALCIHQHSVAGARMFSICQKVAPAPVA
jgi:hypothetical protein